MKSWKVIYFFYVILSTPIIHPAKEKSSVYLGGDAPSIAFKQTGNLANQSDTKKIKPPSAPACALLLHEALSNYGTLCTDEPEEREDFERRLFNQALFDPIVFEQTNLTNLLILSTKYRANKTKAAKKNFNVYQRKAIQQRCTILRKMIYEKIIRYSAFTYRQENKLFAIARELKPHEKNKKIFIENKSLYITDILLHHCYNEYADAFSYFFKYIPGSECIDLKKTLSAEAKKNRAHNIRKILREELKHRPTPLHKKHSHLDQIREKENQNPLSLLRNKADIAFEQTSKKTLLKQKKPSPHTTPKI